jgi:GNAT superfamily N-acetyltransferase
LINIRRAEFVEVEKLWRERLWPQRKSAIESNSAMILGGGIDLAFMSEKAQFWIAEDLGDESSEGHSERRAIGCLSGHFAGHFAGRPVGRSGDRSGDGFGGGSLDPALANSTRRVPGPREHGGRLYRSRGLWVDQSRRRRGIARQLMRELIDHAQSQGAVAIWTFPRKTAMPFYESMGFRMWSTWLPQQEGDSDLNCYAILEL